MNHDDMLAYYAAPGVFTTVDEFAAQLASIPSDVASVARAVQGLLFHEGWTEAYGISLSSQRSAERELHSAHAMLTRATQLDSRAVNEARSPDKRVVGVCRHFATLFVALLRMRGVPSRARCGFATYFDPDPGKRGDHWVGEYWSDEQARWVSVDAQIDHLQREALRLDFDPLDVPRDRFLVAGDAWRACAEGADPMTFGSAGTKWGLLEVYGNLFQDLAALQRIELLPWGWYGLGTDDRGMKEVDLMDDLAAISSRADVLAFNDLRNLLADDPRLRVPEESVVTALTCDRDTIEDLRSVR